MPVLHGPILDALSLVQPRLRACLMIPTMKNTITQRVMFAEDATQGLSVHEMDAAGPAAMETKAVLDELIEMMR